MPERREEPVDHARLGRVEALGHAELEFVGKAVELEQVFDDGALAAALLGRASQQCAHAAADAEHHGAAVRVEDDELGEQRGGAFLERGEKRRLDLFGRRAVQLDDREELDLALTFVDVVDINDHALHDRDVRGLVARDANEGRQEDALQLVVAQPVGECLGRGRCTVLVAVLRRRAAEQPEALRRPVERAEVWRELQVAARCGLACGVGDLHVGESRSRVACCVFGALEPASAAAAPSTLRAAAVASADATLVF